MNLLYMKYLCIYINMYASYSYIVLPARSHGTDLDCVGKHKKSICWVLFQKKQTTEFDETSGADLT